MDTRSLVFAKTLLYVEGIGGQLDSGAWEKLDPGHQLPTFNHLFLWRRGGQFLIGRIWSSVDGKGRSRYPMILCLHCAGVPVAWAMTNLGGRLDEIQKQCEAAQTAPEVKAILAAATADLRNCVAGQTSDFKAGELSPADGARFLESPALTGPARQGLARVIHQIRSQMSIYSRDSAGAKLTELRPQQIRLPRGVDSVAQSILLWDRILQMTLVPNIPALLMASVEQPWLDATIGEPGKHEFFALRATDKNIPPASDIPYNLDDAVKQRTEQIAAALLSNDAAMASAPEAAPKGGIASLFARAKEKWWLVIFGVSSLALAHGKSGLCHFPFQ
jgi:hypothetical protein